MSNDLYKNNVYNYIKEKIMTCVYKPGTVIDQNELVQELNVSRTPIRDALYSLEQEDLVSILPRRGVIVTSITPRDIINIYSARELAEPYIARTAATAMPEELLLEHKNAFLTHESVLINNHRDLTHCWNDYHFHKALVDSINNPYLSTMMDMILSHNMRFVVLASTIPNRLDSSDKEHLDIIDAMLARDPEDAERRMRVHIEAAKQSAIKSMQFSI